MIKTSCHSRRPTSAQQTSQCSNFFFLAHIALSSVNCPSDYFVLRSTSSRSGFLHQWRWKWSHCSRAENPDTFIRTILFFSYQGRINYIHVLWIVNFVRLRYMSLFSKFMDPLHCVLWSQKLPIEQKMMIYEGRESLNSPYAHVCTTYTFNLIALIILYIATLPAIKFHVKTQR